MTGVLMRRDEDTDRPRKMTRCRQSRRWPSINQEKGPEGKSVLILDFQPSELQENKLLLKPFSL